MGKFLDLSGEQYGRLTPIYHIKGTLSSGRRTTRWLCLCSCGEQHIAEAVHLRSGRTKSCGCYRSEVGGANTASHRMSSSSTYGIWQAMIRRCYNPNAWAYKWYGALGVKVCDRWRFGEDGAGGFQLFLSDMGERPANLSIDRINPTGEYEPGNCRWATAQEQASNKRPRVR